MQKDHLPMLGVGPLYVTAIGLVTAAGIWLCRAGRLNSGDAAALRWPLGVLGALMIAAGAALWTLANVQSRIAQHIRENKLATTGVYAWVRNPIYAAFLLACAGALLLCGNLWLLALPPAYWLYLTLLLRATEEAWLRDLYGREYQDYCRRVNRVFPWFPRKTAKNNPRKGDAEC